MTYHMRATDGGDIVLNPKLKEFSVLHSGA